VEIITVDLPHFTSGGSTLSVCILQSEFMGRSEGGARPGCCWGDRTSESIIPQPLLWLPTMQWWIIWGAGGEFFLPVAVGRAGVRLEAVAVVGC
jgi:hypothetical protein